MTVRITMLIPNYNRPTALAKLLKSVFSSIKTASAEDLIEVLVVDDYSDADISAVIAPYTGHHNFTFKMQLSKCGNAEVAFLSALEYVNTDYVWLLGNDDQVSTDGVQYVLRNLASSDFGFVLLNPYINKTTVKRSFVPISVTSTSVVYQKTEDLFLDFGFVTSTTTFPCLIMKTAPVRAFHRKHQLTKYATVYSHTFTIFGALRDERALFLSPPIVGFTLNERLEEQRKLQRQAPAGIMFYHQSLGLARLIRECSKITNVPIERMGSAFEDEVDKDWMKVVPTQLSHFLTHFFIEQLWREQKNIETPQADFGYLVRSEVEEIVDVIERFGDNDLWSLCAEAVVAFNWQNGSPVWKKHFFRMAQDRLRQHAREKYIDIAKRLPAMAPKKVAMENFVLTSLRGIDGGRYGIGAATHGR
jgi:glycosyltransferase involved in cell wall biosynthesis